jgi:hypothetical protein
VGVLCCSLSYYAIDSIVREFIMGFTIIIINNNNRVRIRYENGHHPVYCGTESLSSSLITEAAHYQHNAYE